MSQKLLLNLPENDLKKIEALIKSGEYMTKAELIRFAIKQFLYNPERMKTFNEMTVKLQKQVRKKGLTRKDIERDLRWVEKQGRNDMVKLLNSTKGASKLKRD